MMVRERMNRGGTCYTPKAECSGCRGTRFFLRLVRSIDIFELGEVESAGNAPFQHRCELLFLPQRLQDRRFALLEFVVLGQGGLDGEDLILVQPSRLLLAVPIWVVTIKTVFGIRLEASSDPLRKFFGAMVGLGGLVTS